MKTNENRQQAQPQAMDYVLKRIHQPEENRASKETKVKHAAPRGALIPLAEVLKNLA